MDNYNDNYEKLIAILEEIFQLNQADLDFGIYRIMNQKSEEIKDFLQNKLIPQVKTIIQGASLGNADDVKKELDDLIAQQEQLGLPKEVIYQIPKVKELQAKYGKAPSSVGIENEVFSHLTNFFRRYYDKGDFISMRRYKKDVYAIPYEGEEVKLHWANHDQYYIKTSEYLKNYAFKLDNGKSVRFELAAAGVEKDNNKATNGKERQFRIDEKNPVQIEEDVMSIFFTYLPSEKKEKREEINIHTFETIKSHLPTNWIADILHKVPTVKNADRTLLEKHINDFTARNTFDYFIHKDLGGFLTRELDFYIKNEVLFLNDIDVKNVDTYRQQLIKLDAIQKIGHKIILFLEQIENFQKKLWLKKKFVVETNYCITLDKIPESYHEEICTNDAQWEEWEQLFTISELPKNLFNGGGKSDRETILKDQSFLVLDTHFFSQDFKDRLLGEFDDLDEQTDGLLISSENFQALNLLQERYKEQIKCVYIDPPYNTGDDGFVYKDTFQHSSWLSMLEGRLLLSHKLINSFGAFFLSIDENEIININILLDKIFGQGNKIRQLTIKANPRGRQADKFIATTHEYLVSFAKDIQNLKLKGLPPDKDYLLEFNKKDDNGEKWRELGLRQRGAASLREDRPDMFFPIYVNPKDGTIRLKKSSSYNIECYPKKSDGRDGRWMWGSKKVEDEVSRVYGRLISNRNEFDIFIKDYLNRNGQQRTKKPKSIWDGKSINTELGGKLLKSLFGIEKIKYPKPIGLLERVSRISLNSKEYILDYFAGSGTTGHAVINLNREDNGNRKYILVEMGEYFDSVTKPRIQKVIYSDGWKDGKPTTRNGSSHIFKYIRLEGYEDTLNNLRLVQQAEKKELFEKNTHFHEDYMLGYMLDFESRESLLNVGNFDKPFDYTLSITANNETEDQSVDMVETFNYLLGLKVKRIWTEEGFKIVSGENRKGESILVIWRNMADKDDVALTTFCQSKGWHKKDNGFDLIYINGGNTLESFKEKGAKWRSQLIETTFHQLMFDIKDV